MSDFKEAINKAKDTANYIKDQTANKINKTI